MTLGSQNIFGGFLLAIVAGNNADVHQVRSEAQEKGEAWDASGLMEDL